MPQTDVPEIMPGKGVREKECVRERETGQETIRE